MERYTGQSVILHGASIATIEQDHTRYELPTKRQKRLKTNGNQASRDILKWPQLISQTANYLIPECRPHEPVVKIRSSTNRPKLAPIRLLSARQLAIESPRRLIPSSTIPIPTSEQILRPLLHPPMAPPMLLVREPEKVQLEPPRLHEANLFKELFEVSRRALRELRPKGQALFFRKVPAVIQELVCNLRDLVFEHVWMDGDGIDDQALSVHVSALTFLITSSQLRDQRRSSHLVKVQRSRSVPGFPAQQLATRPHRRIAKVEIVPLVRIHEADGRPADDRVCVFVPRDSKVGPVVREVFHQHRQIWSWEYRSLAVGSSSKFLMKMFAMAPKSALLASRMSMNSSSKVVKSTALDEAPDSLPLGGMLEACWVDVFYLLVEVEDGLVACFTDSCISNLE